MRRRLLLPALLAVSTLASCGTNDLARPSASPTTTTTAATSTKSATDRATMNSACVTYRDNMVSATDAILALVQQGASAFLTARAIDGAQSGVDAAAALATGEIAAEMRRSSAVLGAISGRIRAARGTLVIDSDASALQASSKQVTDLCNAY